VAGTQSTKIAGTIQYMAPEQLNGAPCVGSDIFAMGAVAYEMLTGQKAFPAKSLVQLIQMQQSGAVTRPSSLRSDVPSAVDPVIGKAVAYDSRERYQNAIDFADDFSKAIRTQGGQTLPLSSPPQEKRSKFPALALGFLVLLVIAAAFWSLTKPKHEKMPPAVAPKRIVTSPKLPERQLLYSIDLVQDQKSSPVDLLQKASFKGGDAIRVRLSSPQAGYLYVVNEGPVRKNGVPDYVLLYPGRSNRSETAENQEVTQPVHFDQQKGTEKMWIVSSKNAVAEFEAIRRFLNPVDKGEVNDAADAAAVARFFANHPSNASALFEKDLNRMQIKANGDLIVYHLLLEHD
jgi:serine/threonine protein kinase